MASHLASQGDQKSDLSVEYGNRYHYQVFQNLPMKLPRTFLVIAPTFLALLSNQFVCASPKYSIGASESSTYNEAQAISCPSPEIPAELHEQCFQSCCIARFIIKPDGKSSVRLISSSGSPQVDDLALSTLQRWRFKPAMLNGKPIQSTRKVKVEFEVE